MKVLVIGSSLIDCTLETNTDCEVNHFNYDTINYAGTGLISAKLLSDWGVDASLLTNAGIDEDGKNLLDFLKENDIDVKLVAEENKTEKRITILNKEKNEKKVYYISCKKNYKNVGINGPYDIILINDSKLAINLIDELKGIIVLNAKENDEETLKLMEKANYIIASKSFAESLSAQRIDYFRPDSLKEVLKSIENKTNAKIIITLGEKGTLYRKDDKIKVMGALKVQSLDDSYCKSIYNASFVYALTENLEIEKALKIATISLGLSLKKVGALNSIPDIREVHKIYGKNK